jgi:hypothetical protein
MYDSMNRSPWNSEPAADRTRVQSASSCEAHMQICVFRKQKKRHRSPGSGTILEHLPTSWPPHFSLVTFFKGTQAWDNLDFSIPKSNPYMPFVNFRKKFRFFSFDFCQNFDVWTFPRWLSIRGTKFFVRDIQTNFFSKASLWS